MENSTLRQLIRESINDYIREIDEAGNIAALEAKMNKTEEAISKRKKMVAMEGLDEEMKGMIDEKKVKEMSAEIKALEKSLVRYQKQLDKLKNKSEKVAKVEDTEEKEIVDEVNIDENFPESGPQLEEAKKKKAAKKEEKEPVNESFLKMQKLAGIITEAEYKQKVEILNEGKYFTNYEDVKKEINANKGYQAIFKVEPEEKSAISDELKPHLGKLVSIEASHGGKADTLNTYKENGDKIQQQSEIIKNLGEGGDISFLKLYAIVGGSDNPKKIKKQDGSGFENNPNYDSNKLSNFPIVKKY